jgi:hypothetical protein
MKHILTSLLLSCALSVLAVVPTGLGLSNVATIARATASGGGGSTSYTNSGGSGNRSGVITYTQSSGNVYFIASQLIDGTTASGVSYMNNTPDGGWFQFDFGTSRLFDEARCYQSNSSTHGTWKTQASPDASSWTDIGSSFTLGGSTLQTISSLNGNATSYRYLRFLKVSGTTSFSPTVYEWEFRLGP